MTLYVVATPLGNLGDLTARAAEVLRTVPVVAAEDTRHTRGLLEHIGAAPQLLSFHAYSPERRLASLLEILEGGRDVALVSDAGTPLISDPGVELVDAVRARGIPVVPIPGPSAVATALSVAGLGGDRYLFLGFVPRKGADRRRLLDRAATEEWPVVFFEAAPRVGTLLEDLAQRAGGERRVAVARELTKLHEEVRVGTLADLSAAYAAAPPRGEVTVVLAGLGKPPEAPDRSEEAAELARALLEGGMTRREVVREVTDRLALPRNDVYRMVMEIA